MTETMRLKIKIQLFSGENIAMGPGKAALLDAIAASGSISAAGRVLGMSYRRTWLLVDMMNRCWAEPLVETAAGGARGGGARLTETGRTVLDMYRAIEGRIAAAADCPELGAMEAMLLPEAKPSRN